MRFMLAAIGMAFFLIGGPALAIEQPRFTVQLKDGDVEVRNYQPYVVAEVVVAGDQGQAVQKGFRELAAYIFGANHGHAKIAMTAPVAQRPKGEKIAMTAPVAQAPASGGLWTVQFMMPSRYSLQTLPKPDNPDIHFRVVPAREMAVLTFSGVARDPDYRERSAALRRWMAARGLEAQGDAVLAQYDPPWIPWFMRRNEVMIEVAR